MRFFARRVMALAGPLTVNGQAVSCTKCGSTDNHQVLYARRTDEKSAQLKCRAGHTFTSPALPASVTHQLRYADEGRVQIRVRGDGGQQAVVKGIVAKDSMAADPKGKKGGALAKGQAATAAKTGKPVPVPAAAARPAGRGGGGGTLAATINLLAAGVNTINTAVSTVGTVAGAAGQIAGAAGQIANSAAKVGGEGLGLARDSVRVGGKALDGKIKQIVTAAQHTEAGRIRAHTAAEAAAIRQHRADEAERLRQHRANEKAAEHQRKEERAQTRAAAAERARQERIARRRSAGQRNKKKTAKAQATEAVVEVPTVDLSDYS